MHAPRDDGLLAEGLLDGLLAGVTPEPPGPIDAVSQAVEAHREHARAWYGDLVGPLSVPVPAVLPFVEALRPSDHALRVVLLGLWPGAPRATDPMLAAETDEDLLRAARAQLLDDDRVELAGLELSLPPAPTPADAAGQALTTLDAAAPAWLRIPADPDWIEALDVIADDGAERVALILPGAADDAAHQRLAAMIQSLVSRGVRFSLAGAPGSPGIDLVTGDQGYGLLNLLCAVGAAAEAAAAEAAAVAAGDAAPIGDHAARLGRLADLLGQADPELIIDQARRIGPPTTAAIRGRLERIACGSVRALVSDLEAAGLIVPDVA